MLSWASTGMAAEKSTTKAISPDGRFALRLTEPKDDNSEWKVDVIEKASGKVVFDLGTAYGSHLSQTILVWSADSKRAAFGARGDKDGETTVIFRDGAKFKLVPLPEDLPSPDIKFAKGAGADVKNYGGAVMPVRWLKSGALEMSSDGMMLSRVDEHSYTGTIHFTVGFDSQNHAKVINIGKTKTHVDD